MVTDQELQAFCEHVTAKRNAYYDAQGFANSTREPHAFQRGPKYARIVCVEDGKPSSVFCFVDLANGNILKAASWKTPAKHPRGNIANGSADVTPYGAQYLR
jgi:hypothetical protein